MKMKAIVQKTMREKALEDLKNCVIDPNLVAELKQATPEFKKAHPVIVSKDGIIIDGANRLSADPQWNIEVVDIPLKDALTMRHELEVRRKSESYQKDSLKKTILRKLQYYTQTEEGKKEWADWKEQHTSVFVDDRGREHRRVPAMTSKVAEDLGFSPQYVRKFFPKEHKRKHEEKPKEGLDETGVSFKQKPIEEGVPKQPEQPVLPTKEPEREKKEGIKPTRDIAWENAYKDLRKEFNELQEKYEKLKSNYQYVTNLCQHYEALKKTCPHPKEWRTIPPELQGKMRCSFCGKEGV